MTSYGLNKILSSMRSDLEAISYESKDVSGYASQAKLRLSEALMWLEKESTEVDEQEEKDRMY